MEGNSAVNKGRTNLDQSVEQLVVWSGPLVPYRISSIGVDLTVQDLPKQSQAIQSNSQSPSKIPMTKGLTGNRSQDDDEHKGFYLLVLLVLLVLSAER